METRGVKLGIPPVKRFHLKILFLLHLMFITWALLYPWVSQAYLFHCLVYLALLLSTIVQEGEEQVQLCLAVNLISILPDIVLLALFFPRYSSEVLFSAVSAVCNLFLRLPSAYYLYFEWCQRSGAGGVEVADGRAPRAPPAEVNTTHSTPTGEGQQQQQHPAAPFHVVDLQAGQTS